MTGIDPSHAARVAAYDTAMRERARLLRGEVGAAQADLDAWLDALEAEMAGAAVAIAASRCEAVDALNWRWAKAKARSRAPAWRPRARWRPGSAKGRRWRPRTG